MIDAGGARESIRRRLLVFLIPTMLLLVAGAALVTYWVALRSADNAYDRALLDPIIDLAENIKSDGNGARLELSTDVQKALLNDQSDQLFFQIRSVDGKLIAGVDDLPRPEQILTGQNFFDATFRGEPIRIAAMQTPSGFIVEVGETLNKRHRLIKEILATVLIPTMLMALISILLALLGVARGLAPLERVRNELLERSPQDLRPLNEHAVPSELVPAIAAFNRLLHRLRSSSEMQQRFLANAAHQLRTPLAGLQMHLELLLLRDLPPDVKGEVSTLHVATTRASRLAGQLLALAKAESAHADPQALQAVDLKAIADAAASDWVPRAVALGIDLGFSLEHSPTRGNPVLLRELFNNLVDNALRYTPPGGSVTVRAGESGATAFLSVDDTGPGIPESARARVFERFYRVDQAHGDGSGLGLAIVKEVAEQHAASVRVETSESGRGTRIVVSFPASS